MVVRKMIRPEELKKNEPMLWSPGTGVEVWNMITAARTGDLGSLRRLVKKNPALVRSHYHYRRPLYFAVRENRLDCARFLIENQAEPLGMAVNGGLLEIAADRGYGQMIALLESLYLSTQGANPEGNPLGGLIRNRKVRECKAALKARPELLHQGDETGNQPIHWAVMTRQIPIIDHLLSLGADINARRQDGARPIHLSNGDYNFRGWRDVPSSSKSTPAEVLRHLMARGAYVDIWTACHQGDLPRVRLLLDENPALANTNSEYNSYYLGCGSPLRNAAARGHFDIVKLLVERGADVNLPEEHIAPKGHALYSAVYHGHYEIAKYLLEKGAYPNVPVESSADTLSIALSHDDKPMVELLCSYGAARSLDLLTYYGDVQTAAAIFEQNPGLANDPECFANAASNGHTAFVRLMMRLFPDLPKRARLVTTKNLELLDFLFDHGLDPNQADFLGITPLHEHARGGNLELASRFVARGADLHARDEDLCSTPLAWAAKFGQLEMVKFLLKSGAKPVHPEDPAWATPLAWATRRKHEKIAALLKKRQHRR